MCAVSAIGDDYSKRLPEKYPNRPWDAIPYDPWIHPQFPFTPVVPPAPSKLPAAITVTNAELLEKMTELQNELKKLREDVIEMKKILLVAKEYDEKNNEPHCEMDEKVAVLKKIAEYVGVDLSEVFDK